MMTFWKWLKRSLYTLFALILIIATLMTLVLTTELGNRALLSQAHHFVPGELEYGEYSGALLRDFTLRDVRYRDSNQDIDIEVGDIHLRWRPWELLARKLHIRDFSADYIRIAVPATDGETPAEPTEWPEQLPDISLPLQVRIDQALITNVVVSQGEQDFVVERVSMRGRTRGDTLHLHSFVATTPDFHVQLHGTLTPQGDYAVSINNLLRFHVPEQGDVTVTGQLTGNQHTLQLRQTISGFISADVNVEVSDPLTSDLRWQGDIRAMQSRTQTTVPDLEYFLAELRGSGTLTSFQGALRIEGEHDEYGAFNANTQANYADEVASLDTLYVRADQLGLLIDWTGQADITTEEADGTTTISMIQASMGGSLKYGDYPPVDVRFDYQGDLESAEDLRARIESEEGTINLSGRLGWADGLSWDLNAIVGNVQLDSYHDNISGIIAAEIMSKGTWHDKGDFEVIVGRLDGMVNGRNIDASGRVNWQGDRVHTQDLRVTLDESLLLIELDLDLAETLLAARINGSSLAFDDWTLAEMDADVRIDWSIDELPVGTIAIRDLAQHENILLQTLTLSAERSDNLYSFDVMGTGQAAEVTLQTSGTWENNHWDGTLHRVHITHPDAGEWRTTRESAMQFSPARAQVSRFCIERIRQNAGFCLDMDWDLESNTGRLNADAQAIRLALLQPLMPEQVQINGVLDAQANLDIMPDRFDIDGFVTISDSDVLLPEQDIALRFRESELFRIRGNERELALQFQLLTDDLDGGIEGQATITNALNDPQIQGRSNLTLDNLGFISILVPQLQAVVGRVRGELTYQGALASPAIEGQIELLDAGAEVPAAGINVTELQVNILGSGNEGEPFTLVASARSGDGVVEFEGQYDFLNARAELQVIGSNFQAMQTRDMAVAVSPDLRIVYTPEGLRIRGEVNVPRARITPPDIEQIDTSSRDTIIVRGDETVFAFEERDLPIDADVQVSLGDQVRVEAFGFEGRLTGRLRVIEQPGQQTTAVGNINVATGRYEIFGQPLDIERGSLVFTGGVISNPGLDLRVSRRIPAENVVVGASVGGTLREPNLSFFSTPAMQDSMVLSYLVLGRSPGEGSGEQSAFAQATLALGMRGGNLIGEQIGQALGVDEIMLDATGDNLENTSLFIGKHLSSRLYVKYGIGLIEPVTTFFIRYRLTDSLSFESQTGGERSGADLFYTIER
ncbi:translocation/assembly module TamB domain-containing protein [Aliidiomarina indica]|uniref:translocation/assembly module TamB domain-containing protein n=1 Tax=Aliidiomarina indica TaxID=2749147 RepID=UPI00188E2EB0|nr:translocation/assembly module TamB domain-containing protein [Aliidiomarina indica]